MQEGIKHNIKMHPETVELVNFLVISDRCWLGGTKQM